MDWALWRPREDTLTSIKELLQDALIPDSEIQKAVQTKLKNFEIVEDFTYYLLYIVGQTHFSEEIRSLSGILLKNNITTVYNKLPQESIMKIRHLCLMLLRDQCRDVRTSISNVIYTLAKDKLNTWPELIPVLVKAFESGDEFSDVALTTLFSVCEELMNMPKSKEEICMVTKDVFPKFVDFLTDESCDKKQNIIKLINQFLQEHDAIMKQSIDLGKYLRNVIQLADSEDIDMQKYICHTFVIYIEFREECILPHLHDIIMYLLVKTQHDDFDVALGACEFWLALTKVSNCKEILLPYIDKLVPILLKNMKYSAFELIALKDTLRVDEQEENSREQFPFHMHEKRISSSSRDDSYDEDEYLGNCDDVDNFYVGWTLRKCSAASLDAISVKFGEDILQLIVPFLNELLYHQDFLIKESAILALGAISEGCLTGLKPHLPYLIEYLIHSMGDNHSMVRIITCWTLSRYVSWIISSQPSHTVYFIPVMTILLKHFTDENKRVQRAAISAFCVFQEEAQVKLIPYIDLILEGFQLGFQKFHYRSLYLLYDAINVLAVAVGGELSKPEYIEKLMPPLMQKMNEYANYSDDHFVAILECLANVIPALDYGFLPYSEEIFTQCMDILLDTFMADTNFQAHLNNYEPPNKEPMHVALDVLCSMAIALKTYFCKYVSNSNLMCMLLTTMQDCSHHIRQSSIALYGELVVICYPYVSTISVGDYIRLLTKNLDQNYDGVCKNSAWVLGKLATAMGTDFQPYVEDVFVAFVAILRNPNISRAVLQNVTVALCIICFIYPEITISEGGEVVLKNCCLSLRILKDSEEKDLAFRGLCHMVVRQPEFCSRNFMYFCDAAASWTVVKSDLKEIIKSILVTFKERCDELAWMQFYGQFPDVLKLQLYNLKCPHCLIAPLIQLVIQEIRKACKKEPTACGFNVADNAYEPLKLMQTVMARTNEICLRYLDNSMLCSLPPPGLPHNTTSVCAMKNKRRRMEDRHVVINDLNTMFSIQGATPSSYYAIFDGHAGHDAAAYSSAHLHQFLAESEHFNVDAKQALYDAFRRTDHLFVEKCKIESLSSSGTTAVCALLRPKEKLLYVAWVGDSQAILVHQGRVLECVQSHKPSRQDEKERIEQAGGYVSFWGTWRVNGQLAVSRAIGDFDYKPAVIAVPDIHEIPLDGGEDFLILACDGLWDYVSEDAAATTVYDLVCEAPDKTDRISERLVQLSKEQGSTDNISVIVVFLREPAKVAADAQKRASRTGSKMETATSLDNANNPFTINGDNSILCQKTSPSNNTNNSDSAADEAASDGLLLNLSESFKQNGGGSDNDFELLTNLGKNKNGGSKRSASELDEDFEDDDDLGPETDVDALDDDVVVSPSILAAKALAEGIVMNNNPLEDVVGGFSNPFVENNHHNLIKNNVIDADLDLQKQQSSEFDGERSPREETPTPPADAVHDGGLEETAADSGEESEDEWNYIKGEEANKENIHPVEPPTQPDILGGEGGEEDDEDNMSQLNPNAAEFVPVSPTRSNPSPVCRTLLNDAVIAQSPKRPTEIDINLPNPKDFEKEVKLRPSDFDSYSNGHNVDNTPEDTNKASPQELMENILNGKHIDEIAEFQPDSSPSKISASLSDEFHFGPNAAPFTPSSKQLLDQSEDALSTKADFGDDTNALLDTSFDLSPPAAAEDATDFSNQYQKSRPKETDDPMSMSFYQDKGAAGDNSAAVVDPFDLDRVQILPDNLEDFLNKSEEKEKEQQQGEKILDDSISDLPEHDPSVGLLLNDFVLNNDERIQTTDLDKSNGDEEEKELASPATPDFNEMFTGVCKLPQSPEVVQQQQQHDLIINNELSGENVLPDVCARSESKSPQLQPELLVASPEPKIVDFLADSQPSPQVLSPCLSSPPQILSPEPPQQQQPILSPEPVQTAAASFVDIAEEKEEEEVVCKESPVDDITSSVKDLSSSPVSPVPDVVEELLPVDEDKVTAPAAVAEVNNTIVVEEKIETEEFASPEKNEELLSDLVECSTPKSVATTTDVNSFLERSNILTSPLSPMEDLPSTVLIEQTKTESESPATPIIIESASEPLVPSSQEEAVVAVAATAAVVAATAAAITAEKKSSPKSKASPIAKKTPAAKSAAASPTKARTAAAAAAPKPRVGLAAAASKPAPAKASTGTVPKAPASARPAPKPRTNTGSASKTTVEKKSLTNGDVKPAVKSTLTARKALDVKAAPKPAAAVAAKLNSTGTTTKPAVPKTGVTKSVAAKPLVSAPRTTRPTTLTKTTSAAASSARTTTTITKSTVSKSATASSATGLSSSRPTTAPAKPRVPLSLSKSMAAKSTTDNEKQNKDSANKLTASRTSATRTTTSARTATSTSSVRKIESKVSGTTTTQSRTKTTSSTAITKKPSDSTARAITKTKTTKIEKPIQNGVSTVVTEQITTIVNNSVNENESLQMLQKDNSPVDNKLIVDANAAD